MTNALGRADPLHVGRCRSGKWGVPLHARHGHEDRQLGVPADPGAGGGTGGASLPAEARYIPSHTLSLPRLRRGRSAAQYWSDLLKTAQSAYRLARIIRRERVALVHVNEILDVYAGIAARLARVPCVWHVRADVSTWPSPLRKVLPRIVVALASEIVAVSDSVRREVFLKQGIETPKVL